MKKISDYLKSYQHAIFEMKKQYNLRNINVPITTNKSKPKIYSPKLTEQNKDTPPHGKDIEKTPSAFNLENEISKIKNLFPLVKSLRSLSIGAKFSRCLTLSLDLQTF